jgi:hypothetical protein
METEVLYAVGQLKRAFIADYVVLGGGLVHRFDRLPKGIVRGQNENAFLGGSVYGKGNAILAS